MPDQTKLRIEKHLARAHAALWAAAQEAETLSDQGLADDVYQISAEVSRLHVALLEVRRPRSRPAG